MEQSDLLRFMAVLLEKLGLRYFVTGSTVSIFFGEPRFTNDIDIVVDLPMNHVARFCSEFAEDEFYLSEDTVRRAVQRQGQFNILHPGSGFKVDVMVPSDTMFNRSRFARMKRVKPESDFEANFSSAEDVIVKKMDFFREGGSEKHLRDITGILRISGEDLDHEYIENWAENMGLETIWRTLLVSIRPKVPPRTD